jgi:hypothetical protein
MCPSFVCATPDAHIIYSKATVLLSTNVGLLAWSDNGKTGGISSPTAAQIMTYISIICSVGSIVVSFVILRQYHAVDSPLRVVMPIAIDLLFGLPLPQVVGLKRILKSSFGLERLAIMFSLPYALLVWGYVGHSEI